jgi:hydrogenase 3 maturation protease
LIVRALAQRDYASDADRFLILEAGQAPENSTGALRSYNPDLILFLDAADMGEAPGAVQWVPEGEIEGMSASTHSLPLSMLARYLRLELGCKIALLGIQPCANEIGEAVSEKVLPAIEEVVAVLDECFRTDIRSPRS